MFINLHEHIVKSLVCVLLGYYRGFLFFEGRGGGGIVPKGSTLPF